MLMLSVMIIMWMHADLNRFWDRVASAVAEGEVGEVDVVAVHELSEPGSEEQ